jgi:hypothetical protein
MKTIATATGALVLALTLSGAALAQTSTTHARHAGHHRLHHANARTGIGPGGDQDGDNHGAPSDGDGNF